MLLLYWPIVFLLSAKFSILNVILKGFGDTVKSLIRLKDLFSE